MSNDITNPSHDRSSVQTNDGETPADASSALSDSRRPVIKGTDPSPKRKRKNKKSYRLSKTEYERRKALHLKLNYDPSLPIEGERASIVESIRNHQVTIVCGETGSGKSTQLPKYCWEAGLGRRGWIGHTQPRRLAARSVANRIASELETQVGDVVGYKMRFTDKVSESTIIKLMTDGILLSEIQHGPLLNQYDCIIIDEAHERSINIDLTMAHLKRILAKRPRFRVIITSATIDAEKFAKYFGSEDKPAPVFLVSGRTYPVEIRHRAYAENFNALNDAIDELRQEPSGDILVFLPTEREIRFNEKQIKGLLTARGLLDRFDVLPLFARMTEAEQNKIFNPGGKPRIILATNVAESSITVPRVRYVIDSGLARISRYAARSKVQRLPIEPISQASANQRAGRCGRVADGVCIRLYSEEDYASRSAFTTPEIRRANLAHVMLQVKLAGVHDLESLDWLESPLPESIREAKSTLHELNAIDDEERLTELGRRLGRWPVDPRIARILIAAHENHCLADCLIIASALEIQDPRLRPAEKQNAADEAHAIFQHAASDFGSILLLWDFYHNLKSTLSRSKLEKACQQRFLSTARFREWLDVHHQLQRLTEAQHMHIGERRWKPATLNRASPNTQRENSKKARTDADRSQPIDPIKQEVDALLKDASYQAIHCSLLTGLLSGIAMRREDGKYSAASRLEVQLWPGSAVKQSTPRWIVASEIVETSQRYVRNVAAIESYWLADLAQHLIKYSYESPHFSSKLGQAMIHRKAHLFGLPALPADRVPLSPIDPNTARQLLIDEGIVNAQMKTRTRFVIENAKLLEELEELAHRSRRQQWILDRFQLEAFYHQRIPADVIDRASLERWDKTIDSEIANDASPYLKHSEIWKTLDRKQVLEAYPEAINVGGAQVPVTYQFAPGSENDGITAFVPQTALAQISEDRIGWLVPGLLRDRVLGLIKSLPKKLRRNLSPAPNAADEISRRMLQSDPNSTSFWTTLCKVASEVAGEQIQKSDFEPERLDQHLKLQIAVVDEKGQVTKTTRDVAALQTVAPKQGTDQKQIDGFTLTNQPWYRTGLKDFSIPALPESIVVNVAGSAITRYPTLAIKSDGVEVAIVDHPQAAEQDLRVGVGQLLRSVYHRELMGQVRYLPGLREAKINLGRKINSAKLEDGLALLLVRIAFLDKQPPVRTKDDFDLFKVRAFERMSMAASEVGKWLPKVAEAYQKVSLQLETAKLPANVRADILDQLDWLFHEEFLANHPWELLREFPRYLNAVEHRARKASAGGTVADAKAMQTLIGFQQFFDQKMKNAPAVVPADQPLLVYRGQALGLLAELGFMLQELRVSLFAQQLGTIVSVSAKRLEKLCDNLR